MFIEYIKLKNFGVIEEEMISLQDGLVVVRGRNGSGKTSRCIEAPNYAFFGTSALSADVADTVRQGEKVSSMRVEIKYGPYIIKRSKTSASVIGPDVEISGQEEVSNFFYELFGIMKGTSQYVLVSEQGETAGILKKKPKEVTNLIESLAGFFQIDELIERVVSGFPYGMKAVYEEQLGETDRILLELASADLPNLVLLKSKKIEAGDAVVEKTTIVSKLETEVEGRREKIEEIKEENNDIKIFDTLLTNKLSTLDEKQSDLKVIEEKVYQRFTQKELTKAQELLDSVMVMKERWLAYKWVNSLESLDIWEGDFSSFNTELKNVKAKVVREGEEIVRLKTYIASKQESIITDDKCDKCGQDVAHLHEELNKETELEIKLLTVKLKEVTDDHPAIKNYFETLSDILVKHTSRVSQSAEHMSYMEVNKNAIPYVYSYPGKPPVSPDELAIKSASTLLQEHSGVVAMIKSDKQVAEAIEEKIELLTKVVSEMRGSVKSKRKLKDIQPFEDALKAKITEKNIQQANLDAFNVAFNTHIREIALAKQEVKHHQEREVEVKKNIQGLQEKLKVDSYNSKMIKNIRNAKPIVLNTVWNKILYVVSATFSEMLGKEVVVERTAKGFRINDLPVTRLSGSEKSILGIALRSALRDIFAPGVGTIFFDEPAADCDAERTAKVLTAIQMIPGQKILVTHEDLSEQSADQIIEVE